MLKLEVSYRAIIVAVLAVAALWAVDPKFAAAIEATEGQPSYPCEPTQAGPPTVSV